jgi:carbamoyltransferase
MGHRGRWYVGLNHGNHDAACALVRDNELVVAVEQERLSRTKRAVEESPVDALKYCLDFAGIKLSDVAGVALGSDHDDLARWLGLGEHDRRLQLPYDDPERLFPFNVFGLHNTPPLYPQRHHMAHAASAFWPSGFSDAAILVMDAMGEDSAGILAYGSDKKIDVLQDLPISSSLGFYYEAASLYTGLGKDDAGKLMALAGYGHKIHPAPLKVIDGQATWSGVPVSKRIGRAHLDDRRDALIGVFEQTSFPFMRAVKEEVMAYANFAASIQASLESAIFQLAEEVKRITGARRIVLAGGVALNCTSNGKLSQSGLFDEVYIQPAAHDAGTAVGAALLLANDCIDVAPARMTTPYLGPMESDEEILETLKQTGHRYEWLSYGNLCRRVAGLIADGAIVAWHQGRGELGLRALGARSLLADPRSRRSLVCLNKIKGREMWRPVAPSVLAERFTDYFLGVPNSHMLVAAYVKDAKRAEIPAVVHVDGSARPQAVYREIAPHYWELISEFERLTKIPIVVNTSLNLQNEPIACTARDTLAVLDNSAVGFAAIGGAFVSKS